MPRWMRTASAWMVPLAIGRRKLVELVIPIATAPREWTAWLVPSDAIASPIAASTPRSGRRSHRWDYSGRLQELAANGDRGADAGVTRLHELEPEVPVEGRDL